MKKVSILAIAMAAAMILAGGDALADKAPKAFKKCKICHSVKPGKHKIGPSLFGVYGRKAGTAEGFNNGKKRDYKALKGADWVWDDKSLDGWLENPKKFTGGKKTKMTAKTKKAKDRKALIEYLKTLK
ncbi:MAG: c-type cytochrome [Rhodospirillales bacterium]